MALKYTEKRVRTADASVAEKECKQLAAYANHLETNMRLQVWLPCGSDLGVKYMYLRFIGG